jgi:asparagine synthase (glutamine-hydrolysing)
LRNLNRFFFHQQRNGEIYNYIELRDQLEKAGHRFRTRSDTEVIIHLYEEHGEDCLQHLRGMFAFAIWDGNKKQLMLARDRLGIKPLYYAETKQQVLLFGSEIKAILAAGEIARSVDAAALKNLFLFGFVPSPTTMFASIKKLAPGHYLLYRQGRVAMHQYWELHFPRPAETEDLSAEEWSERLHDKLLEVIRIHLRSDVPVGAWLSSGIDSSTIVALMHGMSAKSLHTYSLVFADAPGHDEIHRSPTLNSFPGFDFPNQRIICHKDHFALYPKTLYHLEDPTTSGVHVLQMLLSAATAKNHKVILTGEGADEILGGYPWFRFDKLCRPFSVLPLPVRRLLMLGPLMPRWKPWATQIFLAPRTIGLDRYARMIGAYCGDILPSLLSSEFKDTRAEGSANLPPFQEPASFQRWHPFARMQYIETKTRMVDLIIHGLDSTSMAHSLEARVPFLDHELVELCARIPPSLKMKGLREKYILRRAMARTLPKEILRRKKHGLAAPSSSWLCGKLPSFAAEMLSRDALRDKGYFNGARIHEILTQHRTGRVDHGRLLMAVLGVQLWDEMFVRQRIPAEATQDISRQVS